MKKTTAIRLAVLSLLSSVALAAVAAGQLPVPPVKPGLWEATMTSLDADGHEMPRPEQRAMARMSPEARARMADAMKARGVSMPDANGATKVCLTREIFESGRWQQMASDSGCTSKYSTSGSTWKFHSSCTTFKSESDGETVFNGTESYRTKVTTTATVAGKTNTSTRIVQAKWLGADCGDVKPFTPPPPPPARK
jgi:hypothetical protein